MNLLTRKTGLLAGIVCMSFCAVPVMAQSQPDNGGNPGAAPGGPGGGQRGRFDPAEIRQRMMDRLKTELGTSDDEFKAIQPKLEKVMQARRDSGGFGGGMFGGGRGRGRGGPNGTAAPADAPPAPAPSPVQEKVTALRTLLENKDAKADDIKTALASVREAKTKAKEDLTKSQDDLKSVLTQRQEAVLVMAGMLD